MSSLKGALNKLLGIKPLPSKASLTNIPRHIAIIMDGNGRWSKTNPSLPMNVAYLKGAKTAWDTVKEAAKLGVEVLTLYTFSVENWQRSHREIFIILETTLKAIHSRLDKLNQRNIKCIIIGDKKSFNNSVQNQIHEIEQATKTNSGLTLVFALSYSGQWDILQAVNQVIAKVRRNEFTDETMTSHMFQHLLCLGDYPPPDLLIRTGGEIRISNFLLWQFAYTEFYFTDVLWPDFNKDEFHKALRDYAQRDRRYGTRPE